jgi:hypothetical protein
MVAARGVMLMIFSKLFLLTRAKGNAYAEEKEERAFTKGVMYLIYGLLGTGLYLLIF